MKKSNKIILVGVISILVIVPTISQGYNFNVGDIFEYELLAAKGDLVLGTSVANFTGVNIGMAIIPEGNLFSFNISAIFDTGYLIDIISGTSFEVKIYYDSEFLGRISGITILPIYGAYEFLQGGQPLIDYCSLFGLQLLCYPFIKVDTETWSSAKEMFSTFETDFLSDYGENYRIENFNIKISESRKSNQIETFFKGSYNVSAENIFNFAQSNKFAYSTQTGAILGNWFKGYFQGKLENTTINFVFEQHFEMLGFDLKPFEIGDFATENISGHNTIQTVSSIFLLFIIPILIRKEKERKN